MGAWGPGLYSDDTTCDVRDDYVRNLKSGLSDEQSKQKVLEGFGDLLEDRQVACLVYFALAETQWKYGRLDDETRSRALAILDSGGDIAIWETDSPKDVSARRRTLKSLRSRIVSPQPSPKVIKVEVPREKKLRTSKELGSVFLLPRNDNGQYFALVLVEHVALGHRTLEPMFRVLNWSGSGVPTSQDLVGCHFLPLSIDASGSHQNIGFLELDARVNPLRHVLETEAVFRGEPPPANSSVWVNKENLGRIIGEVFR